MRILLSGASLMPVILYHLSRRAVYRTRAPHAILSLSDKRDEEEEETLALHALERIKISLRAKGYRQDQIDEMTLRKALSLLGVKYIDSEFDEASSKF